MEAGSAIAACTPCAVPPSVVLLPASARHRLKLDPRLGAGNFLHHACAHNPGRDVPLVHGDVPFEVFGVPRRSLSIAEMKAAADRYAAWYVVQGIRPLDLVAVFCADGVQDLLQYVALTAIGAIPVVTNGAMDPAIAAEYFQRVNAVAVVTDRPRHEALAGRLRAGAFRFVTRLDEIAGEDPAALPPGYPHQHDHASPVMITHSSGTTGTPKAVVLQHGRWFHGIRHLLGLDLAEGATRYLSALPASHNAGIAYAMNAILTGAEVMIMSSRSGAAVARAIESFRPSTVVAFPQTYVELAELDLGAFTLDTVTTWINSGDAAHETHIRRLVTHGHHRRGGEVLPGSQFVDGLGSSEMGHSSFRIIHTSTTNHFDRCIGIPQEWVDAAVLDDHGAQLPAGGIGRLGVKSPSVTEGYWNDTLLTYRSRLRGYWLTGDVVFRDRLGHFYHLDRVTDVIATNAGPLYSLQTEELVLKTQQGLADCTIIAGGRDGVEEPILFAIPRAGQEVDPIALLAAVNAGQSARGRPALGRVELVDWPDIPIGVTGKVLKRVLRERFAA